jgi:hypothetical protein
MEERNPIMATRFDKHINVIDSLTKLLIQQDAVQFGQLADYLETLGINTAGDDELTGEHVNQAHVRTPTTLRGRTALVHARGALDELRASLSGDAALAADVSAGAQRRLYSIAVNAGLDGSVAVNKVADLPNG